MTSQATLKFLSVSLAPAAEPVQRLDSKPGNGHCVVFLNSVLITLIVPFSTLHAGWSNRDYWD